MKSTINEKDEFIELVIYNHNNYKAMGKFKIQWTLSYLKLLQFEKPLLFEHFPQSLDF